VEAESVCRGIKIAGTRVMMDPVAVCKVMLRKINDHFQSWLLILGAGSMNQIEEGVYGQNPTNIPLSILNAMPELRVWGLCEHHEAINRHIVLVASLSASYCIWIARAGKAGNGMTIMAMLDLATRNLSQGLVI
jgi:hypothetical protein